MLDLASGLLGKYGEMVKTSFQVQRMGSCELNQLVKVHALLIVHFLRRKDEKVILNNIYYFCLRFEIKYFRL